METREAELHPLQAATDVREKETNAAVQARLGPVSEVRDVVVSCSPR